MVSRVRVMREPPPVPVTGWTPPHEFPRLEAASRLSVDVETYDPNLKINGPGWATGDGHVVGLSVGTPEGEAWYFPIRHEFGGGNMDVEQVLRWARAELGRANQPKLGANLGYDLGWLKREGVEVAGECFDVQIAEPLINEYANGYSLSKLAERYDVEGKDEELLYKWLHDTYGGSPGRAQAANIYRAPPVLVGPYGESDARVPFLVHDKQMKIIQAEGLDRVYDLERALVPLLLEMRWRGVRVDVDKAHQVREELVAREAKYQAKLDELAGFAGCNPDKNKHLVRAFDAMGLKYNLTEKGNPSFTKDFLASLNHPFAQAITDLRQVVTARGTFIDGHVLGHQSNGRIHCQFHQLRQDDGGTVSGRFSSSDPNLQNIPARDKEMTRLIRGLFLPEEGEQWFAPDYSQIEYRELVHFALGPGAEKARDMYRDDPTTDFHNMTHDIILAITGQDIERKPVKCINFGLVFGQGKAATLAAIKALGGEDGDAVFDAYHEGLPFVQHTANIARNRAQERGYIKTMLGRRLRFPFWESADWNERGEMQMNKEYMEQNYGRVVRARTHKALNCVTQSNSADMIKLAMVDIWNAGLPVPLVQVHDELGFSLHPETNKAEAEEIMRLMREAQPLSVPILVDGDWGTNL